MNKEDIESLGWNKDEERFMSIYDTYSKGNYKLVYDDQSYKLHIFVWDPSLEDNYGFGTHSVFSGKCSSKDELQTIMKLLEIK